METGIKAEIKRSKEAFETYLAQGEKGLIILADLRKVKLRTVKCEASQYSTRVIAPKPTAEQLEKYYSLNGNKKENIVQEGQKQDIELPAKKIDDKESLVNKRISKEQQAFFTYIDLINNPSAIVDLAFEWNIQPDRVRNLANNFMERLVEPMPTEEQRETFYLVNKIRKESVNKGRIDFTFIKELLELNSDLVDDYIEKVISGELNLVAVINKIDLYIKHYNVNIKNIEKLTMIKNHLYSNEKYINEERKRRRIEKFSKIMRDNSKQKTIDILEAHLIDSLEIKYLLSKSELREEAFNRNLKQMEYGSPKEQTLYKAYYKKLEEENLEIAGIIKQMSQYLIDGIEKNGMLGKFNILDYYRLTHLRPSIFLMKAQRVLRKQYINRQELVQIMKFLTIVTANSLLCTEEELLNYNLSINNIAVEDEATKIKIIQYLKKNNIPLFLSVYYAALEEYLRGQLNLDNYTLE